MRTRLGGRLVRGVVLAVTLLVWSPAIMFGIAIGVATLAGCAISESGVRPCVVGGLDLGLPLTFMGLMGWVVLAFLPFMAMTLGLGVFWGCLRLGRAALHAVRAARAT